MHDNRAFMCHAVQARPWVCGKWAFTSDWALATGVATRRWVSTERSREIVAHFSEAEEARRKHQTMHGAPEEPLTQPGRPPMRAPAVTTGPDQ